MTFNQKLQEFENIQEIRRSEAEEDRCRMEGEDWELDNVHPLFREILTQHFKRRKGLPGDFDVRPSDEQMEYFKRGGR